MGDVMNIIDETGNGYEVVELAAMRREKKKRKSL